MAKKRLTDVTKWDNPWFQDLSWSERMLWLYLLDKCDHAGCWKKNFRLMAFQTLVDDPEKHLTNGPLSENLEDKGEYYFIPKFLKFQYKHLGESNLHRAVRRDLEERDIPIDNYIGGLEEGCVKGTPGAQEGLVEGSAGADQPLTRGGISISTSFNKKGRSKKFAPPSLQDVKAYVLEKKLSTDPEFFFEYFQEGNWHDSQGKPVKNWKQKLLTWEKVREKKESKEPKWGEDRHWA